jgi:hypothetical protein
LAALFLSTLDPLSDGLKKAARNMLREVMERLKVNRLGLRHGRPEQLVCDDSAGWLAS